MLPLLARSMQNRAAACYPLLNNTASIVGVNIFWHADQEGRANPPYSAWSCVRSNRKTCFSPCHQSIAVQLLSVCFVQTFCLFAGDAVL